MEKYSEKHMDDAFKAAEGSTCLRRSVGAVLVKYGSTVLSGSNYSSQGVCAEKGCFREQMGIPSGESPEKCRAIHAEMALILQANKQGIPLEGCSVYVTCSPCSLCARLLAESKIKKIYYREEYPDPFAFEILDAAGVQYHKV